MSVVFTVLFFCFIGTLSARQTDIDFNRIKLLPKESYHNPVSNFHSRRSILNYNRRNDNDYHSSRFAELRPPMHLLNDASSTTKEKTGKVYQPKEDPRVFYQSNSYIEETNRKNLNNEVSSTYLGRGVVRASDVHRTFWSDRLQHIEANDIDTETCLRCPTDRTLIANAGVDRVILQYPRLLTCSGKKAPRTARFTRMYGPKFGSLLKEGSHVLVGRITNRGKILRTCKMQIHVLLQSCPVPKYLVSNCDTGNETCHFTCRDPKAELWGHNTLTCDQQARWLGQLPVCKARTWCSPPPPPEHGRVSCKGATAPNGWALSEGSSCRIRCARGWRWSPRTAAICRRGHWTHELTCQPNRSK